LIYCTFRCGKAKKGEFLLLKRKKNANGSKNKFGGAYIFAFFVFLSKI
jgi:hypothetical protein